MSTDFLLILPFITVFLAGLSFVYFTVSLVLFIVSSAKRRSGNTGGIAAKRTPLKINLIVSSVIFGVSALSAAVGVALLASAIHYM